MQLPKSKHQILSTISRDYLYCSRTGKTSSFVALPLYCHWCHAELGAIRIISLTSQGEYIAREFTVSQRLREKADAIRVGLAQALARLAGVVRQA
jgi:hypothetical protein